MKNLLIILLFIYSGTSAQTGIGTTTPDASAKLDVSASNKGFLPPKILASERDAIVNPQQALIIFCKKGTFVLFGKMASTFTKSGNAFINSFN